MNIERFEFLFRLYKNDRLRDEDWQEFQAAVRSGDFDDIIKDQFTALAASDEIHQTWTPELEDSMWQVIRNTQSGQSLRNAAGEKTKIRTFKISRARKLLLISLSTAAGLALIFFFFINRPVNRKPVLASNEKKQIEILPGSNKAVLTLANGSRFIMDSSLNGQIAKMGNATFRKSGGTLKVSFISDKTAEEEVGEAIITTPRGGQFELVLPDGSKVWLNSASSLRFPSVFKGKQREVKLSGEGYFEIASNSKVPFIVSVNDMKVSVLGTHFDVMAYTDEKDIKTTLFEGAVNVSEGIQSKLLKPGQQASLTNSGNQMTVSQADLQKVIAWKNGLFQFDNTDLSTIMRQLARWYDIEIVYQTKPDNIALGGSISKNLNLDGVLKLLEANGINHFKIEGKKVIVLQ